jgi:hypothetical protein
MANRWAFESLGRGLHVDTSGTTTIAYADAFTGSTLTGCVVLALLGTAFAIATVSLLESRTRRW